MSLYAVVELGSHTFRYLVADWKDNVLVPKARGRSYVGLGKMVKPDGNLDYVAHEASKETLRTFLRDIVPYKPKKIWAIATGIIREAKDRDAFLSSVEKVLGCKVLLLEGKEEARLSFLGATHSLNASDDVVVFDIGGGSTELGIRSRGIEYFISVPFGCLLLLKKFPGCEKDKDKWDEMKEFFSKELKFRLKKEGLKDFRCLIGTGGTMVSLAAFYKQIHLKDVSPGLISGTELSLEVLQSIKESLFELSVERRAELPGLDPERSAAIMPGIAIVLEILGYFQKEKVVVSFEDLLEGVLVTNLRSQGYGS